MSRVDRFVWAGAATFTAVAVALLAAGEWFRRSSHHGGGSVVLG
jgi:hypothetical protein